MPDRPADPVAEACGLLAGLFARLEDLTAEPVSAAGGPAGFTPRAACAPEPYGQAGRALMTGLEGVRRLEAALRYATAGHPGIRRGLSQGNTRAVLAAIPKLAGGLDEAGEAAAARWLEKWLDEARAVPAIDEAQLWRQLPRQPGSGLPPCCPHCGCYELRVLLDARGGATTHIECWMPGCRDGDGNRPAAETGTDAHGRPVLAWADGRIEVAPDLEG